MSTPPEPYTNLRSASPRQAPVDGNIRRPRRARQDDRRAAKPLAGAKLHGPYCPVTVTLTLRRGGSEPYVEVRNHEGRFFVEGTSAVIELVQQVVRGGHMIEPMGVDVRPDVLAQQKGTSKGEGSTVGG